jgi:hypothetical protein
MSMRADEYTTEPVHILYERAVGANSVLCRVIPGPIVWGDSDSMELFEAATRKPADDEIDTQGGGQKASLVDNIVMAVVDLVHTSNEAVTRDMVAGNL